LEGDIRFYFLAKGSKKRRGWEDSLKDAEFDYEILDSVPFEIKISEDPGYWFFPKKLPNLGEFKRIVISGGLTPVELFIALKSISEGTGYIIWSEATNIFDGNLIFGILRIPIRFLLFSMADLVVCGSPSAERHAKKLGARRTLLNFTTTDIKPFLYEKSHTGKCLNLVYLGRLIKRKRVDTIIRAIEGLNWVKFYIVGEGEEKENLMDLAEKLKVQVEFMGWLDYNLVPKLLRKFDILVVPSEGEVFGYVVIEAIASGVLPIVSDKVGAKDLLFEELIFKVGDPSSLREKILNFMDPRKRMEFVKRLKGERLPLATPEIWAEKFAKALRGYHLDMENFPP
jgi:glycosyltransferase involved in cell wall biosynthesis